MKFFSIILALTLASSTLCDLPVIDVFVESLCPDCMDFIGGSFKQFFQYEDRDSLAVVNFYPYGNAHESWNAQTKRWDFTCQHGANECYGNVVENCALNVLSDEDGQGFLVCLEGNILAQGKDFNKTLSVCVEDANVRNIILQCATSSEGNGLQHAVAQKTPADHKYVPWIVVNGVHDTNTENQILSNMLSYLCQLQGKDCGNKSSLLLKSSNTEKQCLNYNSLNFLQ